MLGRVGESEGLAGAANETGSFMLPIAPFDLPTWSCHGEALFYPETPGRRIMFRSGTSRDGWQVEEKYT